VEVLQSVRASRDPDDDKFLEAAVNGRADVVIRGIVILTPAAYIDRQA
jgi:predicted nucleic acid-binding protein